MRTTPSFLYILKQRLAGKNFLFEFYFKGKKTLDVGCGEGAFLGLDKALMHGVDTNSRVITRLLSEGYKTKLASGDKLPYTDEEFEALNCHNVIEHLTIDKAYGMLSESARVLKKGGYLVLSSETVTKKFWNTFGHVKPYPPESIKKLLRAESREEFEPVTGLEYVGVFYLGDYYKNKILYLLSAFFGYYTTLSRREYFVVLKRI
ncbi:MAG: hypothetical protein RLZZ67_162 [Candidatus Parcubacteria bacterium]|jgi:ubiquinone/menaquinone biosynthesis C-methylase UbiE